MVGVVDMETVRVFRENNYETRFLPRPFDANRVLELFGEEVTDTALAQTLGVNRSTVYKWRRGRYNMLNAYMADRLAMRVGMHPCQLWGNLWWSSAADEQEALEKGA